MDVRIPPGSEENGLVAMIADLIRQNLEAHPERSAEVGPLDLVLGIDAPDVGVSLTLDFLPGSVEVRDGIHRDVEAVMQATSDAILELPLLRVRRSGRPFLWNAAGRKAVLRVLRGHVRVRGLRAAPRLMKLLRLLSVAD
jgi:hypothetical protein